MNKQTIAALVLVVLVGVGFYVARGSVATEAGKILTVAGSLNAAAATESVKIGSDQTILWNPADFKEDSVRVSLVRKLENDAFGLIRILEESTPNDGSALWTPDAEEGGDGIFIVITCVENAEECATSVSPVSFTLVD